MTPTVYVGDHQHAKVVCSAFAEGCGGKLVPATSKLQDGPAAMWGILRGAGDRIKECELYGHPYFYIDHGYFSRGHYDGYYRVVFCDRHLQGPPQPSDGLRWEALGLAVDHDHGGSGSAVLYLPMSRHVAAFMGVDAGEFDGQQLARLRLEFPDREIMVKPKDGGDLMDFLPDCGLAVGFQSNSLLEAARHGVSVRELGRGPAEHLLAAGWDTREFVLNWLADNQWTLAEMRSGKCWSDLMARHGSALAA